MPQPLFDGHVDYPDGTPATIPQMSKDISEFLVWCGEPHIDTKKMWGFQAITYVGIMFLGLVWGKRYVWNTIKYATMNFFQFLISICLL